MEKLINNLETKLSEGYTIIIHSIGNEIFEISARTYDSKGDVLNIINKKSESLLKTIKMVINCAEMKK